MLTLSYIIRNIYCAYLRFITGISYYLFELTSRKMRSQGRFKHLRSRLTFYPGF